MSDRYPRGTAGNIITDYVQRLLRKQQEQGKIQFSQLEGQLGYHQMPPGSTNGGDPSDPSGGTTVINSTPTGPAGDDVIGTYPSGLVVAAIRGYIVDDVEPPDGSVLLFDLDTGHWVPGALPPATVDNEQIDDRVSALIVAGTGITSTYDDTVGTLTIAATGAGISAEEVDDRVNALLVAGTGIVKTYDDVANTLTLQAVGVTGPQGEPGSIGPQGPAGNANARYTEIWTWNTSTAVPPNTSQVRTNSGNWSSATVLRLDKQVQDGRDISAAIMSIKAGDQILMNHRTDATRSALYDVVSDIVQVSTYFTITVALVSIAGVLPTNGTQVALALLTQGITAPQWFTGAAAPTAAIGRIGDMYLEGDGDVWKNTNPSGWGATGTNIRGPSFTTEELDDRVNALIVAGDGITKTYDDSANTLTLAAASDGAGLGVPRVIGVAYLAGALTVGNDQGPNLRLDTPSELVEAHVFAKVAPTGAGTTLDVKQATVPAGPWSSLFSTPLALASGAQVLDVATFAASVLAAGTYFRADVLTIPASGSPPSGVTIQLDLATTEEPEPPAGPTFVTSGLILGYAFSEGSGQTVNDLSSYNYDAVLGSTSSVESNDPAWVTEGLDFNSNQNDCVIAPVVPDTDWLGALTVMVVAKIDVGTAHHNIFIDKGANPAANVPIAFATDNNSANKLWMWRTNSSLNIWDGPTPTLGEYRCYSVTTPAAINAAPTFYVGVTPSTGTVFNIYGSATGAATGTNAPVRIGLRGDNGGAFDGVMSYLLVYNRVLSAAEIAQNYGALIEVMAARGVTLPPIPVTPTIITSGLIWGLAMSEGTGQTLNDLGPNNYDAVLGFNSGFEANDPAWGTTGLSFVSGNSQLVTAPGVPDTDWLGPITVMVVANVTVGSNYRHFLSKHLSNGGSQNPMEFRTDNAATPKLTVIRANTGARTYEGPTITVGSYRCYSVTMDTNIVSVPTFYVGTTSTSGTPIGALLGTGTAPPTGAGAAVEVGRRPDDAVKMHGQISYIVVYNRILSAGEIATNYAALQTIMTARGVTLP